MSSLSKNEFFRNLLVHMNHRVGIAMIFDRRMGVVFHGSAADPGAHQADGVPAGANEGVEFAERIVVDRKEKVG